MFLPDQSDSVVMDSLARENDFRERWERGDRREETGDSPLSPLPF
mgnify:CR=1 FL=1